MTSTDQTNDRAAVEAGYMDVREYVERYGEMVAAPLSAGLGHAVDEIQRLTEANTALRKHIEEMEAAPSYEEYKEALHDLVMLHSEEWAIGGGPGFKDRSKKAWQAALELFEP